MKAEKYTKKRISIRTVAIALLCVLALFNLVTILVSCLGLREELNFLPGAFLKVTNGSMEPEICKGDLIFVWRTPYEEVKTDDVITMYSVGEYVTHKVVKISSDSVTTRGIANENDDVPLPSARYYGKVMFNISGGGVIYDVFTTPLVLILSILAIILIIFAKPAYNLIRNNGKKNRVTLRAALCLTLVSALLVPSMLTTARYTANINGVKTAVASEVLISSNYLSEEGNTYNIAGWNGLEYVIPLKIQNFRNALRYNMEGIDLTYRIKVEKVTEGGFSENYDITVFHPDNTIVHPYIEMKYNGFTESNVGIGDYLTITGADESFKTDTLNIKIDAKNEGNSGSRLATGQKIKLRITAETSETIRYFQTLVGEITIEVAESSSFIASRSLDQALGSTLVKYKLETDAGVAGESEDSMRNVVLEWDAKLMYLNIDEPMVWNLIQDSVQKGPEFSCYKRNVRPGIDSFTFAIPTHSTMTFEFFKMPDMLNHEVKETANVIDAGQENEHDYIRLYDGAGSVFN